MTRLEETIQRIEEFSERQSEGRQADAGFDGGEFSGPAHDKLFDKGVIEIILDSGYSDLTEFYEEAGDKITYELAIAHLFEDGFEHTPNERMVG